jgi:hypothetical protein
MVVPAANDIFISGGRWARFVFVRRNQHEYTAVFSCYGEVWGRGQFRGKLPTIGLIPEPYTSCYDTSTLTNSN